MAVLNDAEFHQQALEGGASRSVATGNVPDRGYMVGGAPMRDNLPFPEIKRPASEFGEVDVRNHARAIRDAFKNYQDVHQGAWREDEHVVLDASEQMSHYHEAVTAAKQRGERAVYDVKRDRDIHVKDVRVVN